MPYALCPLIKRAPHVTEKGYTALSLLTITMENGATRSRIMIALSSLYQRGDVSLRQSLRWVLYLEN